MVRIVSDQYGNVIATGSTAGGNFLIAIGILCFIAGGIFIISGILAGGLSAVIGTLFIYAGQHYTKKVQQKKLDQYLSGEYVDERFKVKMINKKDKNQVRKKRHFAVNPRGLQCPSCGNTTGTANTSCPYCGFVFRGDRDKNKTNFNQEYLDQELDKARLHLERDQKSPDEEKLKVEAQKKQTFEIKESIADELLKLANLKEKGILSEEEFLKMKQDLINKDKNTK
jgi:Short C-terminal domain